jgi:hypothetical protein
MILTSRQHTGADEMTTTYHLNAIGVATIFTGTLNEAIAEAKRLDEEYQRFGGVDIEDEDGNAIANVNNDVVTIE